MRSIRLRCCLVHRHDNLRKRSTLGQIADPLTRWKFQTRRFHALHLEEMPAALAPS